MAVLFEYFEDVDLPAERKKAREAGRTDDLAKAVTDVEYRKNLYLQNNL